jgi:prolipoprotein diacylglyceryltransferase
LGLPLLGFSMGQGLCVAMILVGIGFVMWRRKAAVPAPT